MFGRFEDLAPAHGLQYVREGSAQRRPGRGGTGAVFRRVVGLRSGPDDAEGAGDPALGEGGTVTRPRSARSPSMTATAALVRRLAPHWASSSRTVMVNPASATNAFSRNASGVTHSFADKLVGRRPGSVPVSADAAMRRAAPLRRSEQIVNREPRLYSRSCSMAERGVAHTVPQPPELTSPVGDDGGGTVRIRLADCGVQLPPVAHALRSSISGHPAIAQPCRSASSSRSPWRPARTIDAFVIAPHRSDRPVCPLEAFQRLARDSSGFWSRTPPPIGAWVCMACWPPRDERSDRHAGAAPRIGS